MLDKLQAIFEQSVRLEEQLADPNSMTDMERFAKINKTYQELQPIAAMYHEYRDFLGNIESAREMLTDDDEEMRRMAKDELSVLLPQQEMMEERVKLLLIPKDPEDAKDVIFEIRSGTGGDEASIFAGDLYRMYSRYFDRQGWTTELLSVTEGTVGGYSKLELEVTGENVYGKLKFESGAHRVQRIPETESKGRVHTSAATVVVMPKLEMEDVNINKADLRVDTFRSSGAGGQHVNKTESGVRFTHLPTGVVSECTEGRSQIQNREIALQRLYQRVYDMQKQKHDSQMAASRRSLVGSGDRSDKIRTYNYPQNRVTDHRLEGDYKNWDLQGIVSGNLEEMIGALLVAENTTKMGAEEE